MLRFAPSPTGDMHIGNLRVALLNYLVAQQKNDQFLIRIEDIDSNGNLEGKDTEIMMILEKFALKHTSVFHQTEHLNLYQTLALRLLKEKKAFVCQCSKEELEADKKTAKTNNVPYHYSGRCENLSQEAYAKLKASNQKFVIRLKKPKKTIEYHDLLQGKITATSNEIDSFIILNKDNTPGHNFACATDDMMSNVNFIIREEKHLLNTPKQIHIKNILGYENEIQYAHLPHISYKDDEVISVKWLLKEGFLPDAILNYLLLLGNTKVPKEIFTLPQAVEWFDLNTISKTAVKFDMHKLRLINREHLNMMDNRQLSTLFGFADTDIGKLAKVYLEECSTINELESKIRPIFTAKDFSGDWGEEMKVMAKVIANAPAYESFDELTKHLTNESGLNPLNKPLRYLLTGAENGPELSKVYPFIKSYILEIAS